MTRTAIDLDDGLVIEVSKVLRTSTKEETVNAAPREVLRHRRSALALIRLRELAANGGLDLDLLDDMRNYRR